MYMVHGCQKVAFCVHLVYHAAVTSWIVISTVLPVYAVTVGQIMWANAEDQTICETLLAPPLGMGT